MRSPETASHFRAASQPKKIGWMNINQSHQESEKHAMKVMQSGKTPSQIHKIGGGESWTLNFDIVCEVIGLIISAIFFKGSGKTASNLNQNFLPPKVIGSDRVLLENRKFSNLTLKTVNSQITFNFSDPLWPPLRKPRHLDMDLTAALRAADPSFDWERVPFVLEVWYGVVVLGKTSSCF